MNEDDLPSIGLDEALDFPRELRDESLRTESIDLGNLFAKDVTSSGSFDMRGVQRSSLGRLLDALPIPVILVSKEYCILFSNLASKELLPSGNESPFSDFFNVFARPSDAEKTRELLGQVSKDRKPQTTEGILGTEGRRIWGRMHVRSLRMGPERSLLILVEDLTPEKKQVLLTKKYSKKLREAHGELEKRVQERTADLARANRQLREEIHVRQQTQEHLKLAANVIAGSNEAIMITDSNGLIIEVNDAFSRITEYSRDEVIGENPRMMASGRHSLKFWNDFWHALLTTGQWKGEVWDRRKNGEVFPKLLSVSTLKNEHGDVTHYVGIFSDISSVKESEERLEYLAHYDHLTGLPNRLLFRDRLKHATIQASREGNKVALIFMDLDGFKDINDTKGHVLGDELLKHVAERLKRCVRQSDTVARFGGDEFTVVMGGVSGSHEVITVAERIAGSLSKPFMVFNSEVFVTASLGVSFFPDDGEDVDRLLQNADTAMYHAKALGRNNLQFFSQDLNAEIVDRVELEATLRRSHESNRFVVQYQPIIACRSGKITGSEALLRLRDTNGNLLPPGDFIPVAEDKGLIVPIGEWVLETACRQLQEWRMMGLPRLRMAVNISMRQLRHREFLPTVLRILEETQIGPTSLELELTESAMMSDTSMTIQTLAELRRHGIRIAIDDFGTGYSSLAYLRRLPLQRVKIDRSFTEEIGHEPDGKALVESVVSLAHSLKLEVLAEGVETEEQLDCLRACNCDEWQGFLCSPALSAKDFTKFFRERA